MTRDGLNRWLRALTERGAADLFLVTGFPPQAPDVIVIGEISVGRP